MVRLNLLAHLSIPLFFLDTILAQGASPVQPAFDNEGPRPAETVVKPALEARNLLKSREDRAQLHHALHLARRLVKRGSTIEVPEDDLRELLDQIDTLRKEVSGMLPSENATPSSTRQPEETLSSQSSPLPSSKFQGAFIETSNDSSQDSSEDEDEDSDCSTEDLVSDLPVRRDADCTIASSDDANEAKDASVTEFSASVSATSGGTFQTTSAVTIEESLPSQTPDSLVTSSSPATTMMQGGTENRRTTVFEQDQQLQTLTVTSTSTRQSTMTVTLTYTEVASLSRASGLPSGAVFLQESTDSSDDINDDEDDDGEEEDDDGNDIGEEDNENDEGDEEPPTTKTPSSSLVPETVIANVTVVPVPITSDISNVPTIGSSSSLEVMPDATPGSSTPLLESQSTQPVQFFKAVSPNMTASVTPNSSFRTVTKPTRSIADGASE